MANRPATEPWERQPDESAKAFEAFVTYRDMGPDRSIQRVARECTKSVSLIKRWSRERGWTERIRAWDNNLTEAARKKARKEVEDMQRRHIDIGRYMQSKAVRALDKMPEESITPRDATTLAKLGIEVERMARTETSERTEGKARDSQSLIDAMTEAFNNRKGEPDD